MKIFVDNVWPICQRDFVDNKLAKVISTLQYDTNKFQSEWVWYGMV